MKENNQNEVVIIEEKVEGGKVVIFQEELLNYKKAVEEVKKGKQVLEELQMLVECPVCMTTPKEGPMPCCPAGHLTCAPCLQALKKKGKKTCPLCRGPLGKGKSLLSSAIIKTIEEERSSPQPGPSNSVLSSPVPKKKVVNAIKGRVLAPVKEVGRGSPVLAKKKQSIGGAVKEVGKGSPLLAKFGAVKEVGKGSPFLAKKNQSIGGAVKEVGKGSPLLAQKKQSIGGAALVRFEGTCPLCYKKFMDAVLLETHASECDGGGEPEQVTRFVFPSQICLCCRSHRLSSSCQNTRLVHQPQNLYNEF